MMNWLQNEWKALASTYIKDEGTVLSYWNEISSNYNSNSRHYHNLDHIYNMLLQAENIKNLIIDYDVCRLAIWYHDIVYKSTKKNNEEKSAEFAKKRLKSFNFDEKRLKNIENIIKSTQKHQLILTENYDNAYVLDLDLSILGTDWDDYKKYIHNIRKEYAMYPNFIYNPGRKKVLIHFLKRDAIYFTECFRNQYEKQARENLKKEIELL